MTTVLVTGVTGQDGGYLAERLVAEGCTVHGLVHDGDAHVDQLLERTPSVQLHTGDLADLASLARVVEAVQPDEVYNLAGVSSVARSWSEPVLTADVCALGVARLLSVLPRSTRFVQASSAEVFVDASEVTQTDATPLRPTSPYGLAKVFAQHQVGL